MRNELGDELLVVLLEGGVGLLFELLEDGMREVERDVVIELGDVVVELEGVGEGDGGEDVLLLEVDGDLGVLRLVPVLDERLLLVLPGLRDVEPLLD